MKLLLVLLACLLTAQWVRADTRCSALARSELEQLFCTVRNTPAGAGLPSFSDFRRNSEAVQALLLKGPARKLGLSVPTVAAADPPLAESQVQSAPTQGQSAPAQAPTSVVLGAGPAPAASPNPPPRDPLAECHLGKVEIRCADRHYRLVDNRANHALAEHALTPSNRMDLPSYTGSLDDEQSVNRYLADSYRRYIEKMLSIGLGGVTMSYTRFHHTFWQQIGNNEDFAARFETMFRYLKKDKASMAVSPRHSGQLPNSLTQCFDLTDDLVICDDSDNNWVFVAS